MIREATLGDLPRVLEMGEQFYMAAGWQTFVEWDATSVESTLAFLIDSETGCLLVADVDGEIVGMIGGMVAPHYYNFSVITGQELFWWAKPEYRGAGGDLFDALETWAKAVGATMFTMVAVDKFRPSVMARVYRSKGYAPDSGDWHWTKYEPDGEVSTMKGMRVAGRVNMCIECHKSAGGGDYVFANDR